MTSGGFHGLEAALYDQEDAIWGCDGRNLTGADRTDVGTDAQNTLDTLVACGHQSHAARLADNYSLNGSDDWFFPSKDELTLMYQNLHLAGLGGFQSVNKR